MSREMAKRRLDSAILEGRLRAVLAKRKDIVDLGRTLLGELTEAVAVLEAIRFPFHLSDFPIDPEQALLPIRYIRFLRNRYSTFNLIHEVNLTFQLVGLEGAKKFGCQVKNVTHEGHTTSLGLRFNQVEHSVIDEIKSYVIQVSHFLENE